jgi:hypothetical protein
MTGTRFRRLVSGAIAVAATAAGCDCSSEEDDSPGDPGAGGAASSVTVSSTSISTGSGVGGELPDQFTVTGVVTDGERPVEGAYVMQGGAAEPALITGPDGTFTVQLTKAIPGTPTVVATKIGYRTRGEELFTLPTEPIELAMRFVSTPDNIAYVYGEPGVGDADIDNSTLFCGHCHTTFVKQFQSSAHARSARDPHLQDLYAGVAPKYASESACESAGGVWRQGLEPGTEATATSKCYLGHGVLPDLNPGCGGPTQPACDDPALPAASKPTAFGACADCHAPAIEGEAGGRDLHDAVGNAYENGNHCDFCHHVRDVDMSAPPGTAGRLVLQRPIDKVSDDPTSPLRQVMFGPLYDVPNEFMGGSLQPKFSTAEICAGCHQQEQQALLPGTTLDAKWRDGLPTHSTFAEWTDSPFNDPSTPCQACHMPPDDTGLKSTLDITDEESAGISGGFIRPSERIRQHIFRGPLEGSPRLIDDVVAVALTGAVAGGELSVDVTLENLLAGHAVPTGEPMRALVLAVHADACGAAMVPVGGLTVNDVGGALATGTVATDAQFAAAVVTWPAGAARAKAGDVLRVVRSTGAFDDYPGVGYFADPGLAAAAKGMPVRAPVGQAKVLSVSGSGITLDASLPVQPGDIVYLGDAAATPPLDGDPSRALAGAAGYTFARVLVDPAGERMVPHYRAVDMVSDNRLRPQVPHVTTHSFAVPAGCATAKVTATLLYRPLPVALSRERGWDARDWVIKTATEDIALP